MNLQEITEKYYTQDYNCAETLLHAANEYYDLNMTEDEMKVVAGFGGGMFVGSTCGALCGCIGAISKKIIETKAHEQLPEFRPVIQKCVVNFKKELGATDCKDIKPRFRTEETKCLNTCLHAAAALEDTMKEYGYEPNKMDD